MQGRRCGGSVPGSGCVPLVVGGPGDPGRPVSVTITLVGRCSHHQEGCWAGNGGVSADTEPSPGLLW